MTHKLLPAYGSPDDIIARSTEWLGNYGGQNAGSLLLYEAMQCIKKLVTAPTPSAPKGYVLAPQEPSIAACIRGAAAADNTINGHVAAQVYAAMLHAQRHSAPAAPTPPAVQEADARPVAPAYCEACQSVGMSNCSDFVNCGHVRCSTCKQLWPASSTPASPQEAVPANFPALPDCCTTGPRCGASGACEEAVPAGDIEQRDALAEAIRLHHIVRDAALEEAAVAMDGLYNKAHFQQRTADVSYIEGQKDALDVAESAIRALKGTPAVIWPKGREAGRMGDMTPRGDSHLRVGLDADNDIYVAIYNAEEGQPSSIEFCTPTLGGGQSPRTREALIAVMVAMEADNAETPALAYPQIPTDKEAGHGQAG